MKLVKIKRKETLSNEALEVLPNELEIAYSRALTTYNTALKERRRVFKSLFSPSKQDEVLLQLKAIFRAIDELAGYVVYRNRKSRYATKMFAAALAVQEQHKQFVLEVLKNGNVRCDNLSLHMDDSIHRSMLDEKREIDELDARALGLLCTYNDLVRNLEHYCAQHWIAISKRVPVPPNVYIGGGVIL